MKSTPNRFKNQNVVITGGSSGIGLAIAEEFAKLNAKLFLVARDAPKLATAKAKIAQAYPSVQVIETFTADVANEAEITQVIQSIGNNFGGIHTLINNAGTGACGRFEDVDMDTLQAMMNINYWGSVYALKAALPYLKKSQNGHIGFVSSVGGYLGAIGYSAYAPTKFAITGLAECIRMEASDNGLGTTIVFPPDTDTPLWHWEQEHTLPESKAFSKNVKLMTPESVAQKFVKGILNYKFEVICNFESKMMRWMKVNLPKTYFGMLDGIIKKDRAQRAKESAKKVAV
jgi:3-dehydrosphinganine reductase